MRLRGNNMTERLNKLQREEGALNKYIIKQREKKELQLKLTKDEQGKLENALTNVEYLKSKVKREMTLVKVPDLTLKVNKKADEECITQEQALGQEKINYMIIKAKEEVNEAMKVLFAKDSKLHQLRIQSPDEQKA
jgi:hypothetical protein